MTLGLGENGDEWDFQRIGTESEKSSVEKELHDLREQLAQVEEWKKRKIEIDAELNKVWVDGGDELDVPAYVQEGAAEEEEGQSDVGEEVSEASVVEHAEDENSTASQSEMADSASE